MENKSFKTIFKAALTGIIYTKHLIILMQISFYYIMDILKLNLVLSINSGTTIRLQEYMSHLFLCTRNEKWDSQVIWVRQKDINKFSVRMKVHIVGIYVYYRKKDIFMEFSRFSQAHA